MEMHRPDPQLIETGPLRYLLADAGASPDAGPRPVLIFLHGYGEGPPAGILNALRLHGPLRKDAPEIVREFLVVAPQLPASGDAVREIVRHVQQSHGGDPERTCLTGFSFGANGVFDLALAQQDEPALWAALWAVDPTRAPAADPGLPVWLSFGNLARVNRDELLRCLRLRDAGAAHEAPRGDRLYTDRGENHVESAASAYAEERVYRWLLSHRLPARH
ncbi:MAG: hypothetical protein LC667_17165 [Thioalkalivibrio sp.]|nr:hypothetical protein [Thioalkalivibrio sp.]